MSKYHPTRGRQQKGAFAAGNASSLAASGESTQGTDRDASHAAVAHHLLLLQRGVGEDLVTNETLVSAPYPSSPSWRIQRQLEARTALLVNNAVD